MNRAMQFLDMATNRGKGLGTSTAAAKHDTGCCDEQYPHGIKFVSGEVNVFPQIVLIVLAGIFLARGLTLFNFH